MDLGRCAAVLPVFSTSRWAVFSARLPYSDILQHSVGNETVLLGGASNDIANDELLDSGSLSGAVFAWFDLWQFIDCATA